MKKRRVLALFLAMSMVLSSNSFAVFAAENGQDMEIEANLSEESDGAESGNDVSGESDGIENGNETLGETGSESDALDESGETGNENDASDESGETGNENDASDESDETGNENDASDESGETGSENDSSDESDGTETEGDTSDETDSAETGDDMSDKTDISDEAISSEVIESTLPNMYTFTDETGMVVTYDLNEEAGYVYNVTDGVLTSVTKADGSTLSGTVELKQQEGENAYHTIGENVFKNYTDIEYVILPKGVTTIGKNAFSGYTKLRSITLPVTLTSIEENAFKGCTNMTQLSVPKAVTSIGNSAFYGDVSLFMVYIKDSAYSKMTSIGDSAFYNCRRLNIFGSDTEFILPGYLETIGASAFENCLAIKKLVLPDSVKEKTIVTTDPVTGEETTSTQKALGESVFKNCIGLTDVILSGASVIPKHAFDGCNSLLSVTFANGNITIDEYAFANCPKLGEVIFSYTVKNIGSYAFSSCKELRYVEFPNSDMGASIGETDALPNNNSHELWVRGFADTPIHTYVKAHNNMRFIAYNSDSTESFKYTYQCLSSVEGNIKFYKSDKETAANEKQSFKVGDKIYIFITNTASAMLVDGSLRCNGTPIGKDSDSNYVFEMPVGGAYVTAEFENKNASQSGNRIADNIKYELSNGSTLKVGQTTRMFLIDTSMVADNSVIPDSEIEFSTSDKKIATVSTNGTIRAVAKGKAYITAALYDSKKKLIVSKETAIQVEEADVYSLRLKPLTYDTTVMEVDKNSDGEISGISVWKKDMEGRGALQFTLLATAYDLYEDDMSVALKWATSDSKIAKIAKTNTSNAEPQNTITIPEGAVGAATITVTATNKNPVDKENKTVERKFIVRVKDGEPRISSSSVTLNPYTEDGVSLEIISAYGVNVNKGNVALRRRDDKSQASRNFKLINDDTTEENSSIVKLKVIAIDTAIPDGAYDEYVYVKVGDNEYYLDLKINVKKSIPNPKVKFSSKEKINLFYLGDETEVKPVISGIDNVKIESYGLENLSNNGDDSHFTENFVIDSTTGVITRSYNNMYYTSKKKPVTTGYLVLKFAGYKEGVNEKKIKITVPTKTTKPTYKLERTSDTFSSMSGTQTVELSLLDKKTKQPIEMNSDWSVVIDPSSTTQAVNSVRVNILGNFQMDVNPYGGSGKVVLNVSNDKWDGEQSIKFNYKIKISNKKITFKLSKSTVTLYSCVEGTQTVKVGLKSKQYGIEPTNTTFDSPEKLNAYSDKIEVGNYNPIDQTVEVRFNVPKTGTDINKGSYKFTCYPLGDNGNKVTLTVKVSDAAPKLSFKGSASLNLAAGAGKDTAELTMKIKNPLDNCELDADETEKTIVCTTAAYAGVEESFDWNIENDKLKISLRDTNVAAKTYTFMMTPKYSNYSVMEDKEKSVKFKVKVYRKNISVTLKAKGKLNLLDRYDGTYSAAGETSEPVTLSVTNMNTGSTVVYDDEISENEDGGNPLDPSNPTDPEDPGETDPSDPTDPADPGGTDPSDPTDPNDPGETNPSDPTDPTDPGETDPSDPTNPDDPSDPVESYTVTFDVNGIHAVIRESGEDGQIIADKTDTVIKGSDYVFIVEPENGYGVDVSYTIVDRDNTDDNNENTDDSYENTDTPNVTVPGTVPEMIPCPKDENVEYGYKITADKITGDINIIVTDIYTVTVNDMTVGKIPEFSYKINDGVYNDEEKPTIAYGESLSVKFAPPAGKTIAVLDENGKRLPVDSDSTAEELIYTIDKVDDNRTIIIAPAYEITEEIKQEIKQDGKITASITYDENVVADDLGRIILEDKDLNFKVTPGNGYKITKVAYKLGTGGTETELIAENSADTSDYYSYKIDSSHITDNITIIVTTDWIDPDNYKFEFNINGVSVEIVEIGKGDKTTDPLGVIMPVNIEPRNRFFTFSVTPDADKRLRYVGTDSELKAESPDIIGPDKRSGFYTFKLPQNPDPVTTIYVSATVKAADLKVNFTGLTDGSIEKAKVSTVTFSEDGTKITTKPLVEGYADAVYEEDSKVYFTVETMSEYVLNGIKADGATIISARHSVFVDKETVAREVIIYTIDLANVYRDVTVELTVSLPSTDNVSGYEYNLKNCIMYTPKISNLNDTIVEAKIYDAAVADPVYSGEESKYFNIEVADGLLYVTPKEDLNEDNYLKNNTTYQVKIWLKLEKYDSGDESNGGGIWANNKKVIKIKTAQTLPKVITDTNSLNLYQSNTSYTPAFVVTLKEGSVGQLEGIEFGEKDEKAKGSFNLSSEVQQDGSLKVTLRLKDDSLYAADATYSVKMYVKFKNQAKDTAGTAITMNVKINN